ncbi:MAG: dockerin type I domain-containing protein, partial [Clostridiales Family XIII bacterium]|jgi:hypothetical protein|nr:dockerin type I domain-containing protein [Clostridiales Family XIII bacterium]
VDARKYWCPVFAQLDADFVLQGHDHVYSRGFVNADGTKALDAPVGSTVSDPENAPLYMIGGHAGGLKWYSMKNYTVGAGDPLLPNYAFLDVDSANPGHNADSRGSDSKREQVIVELAVSEEKVDIKCYMFKYDEASDAITTGKYLYDSLTVLKADGEEEPEDDGKPTASVSGPVAADIKDGEEIEYVVSYSNLDNANAFDTAIEYDAGKLELVKAESIPSDASFSYPTADAENGKIALITGLSKPVSGDQDIAKFVFKVKSDAQTGQTIVKLVRANTVAAKLDESGNMLVGSVDVSAEIKGDASTEITDEIPETPETPPEDVNGDGEFTLADLSMALGHYQSTDPADLAEYDLNGDGVIDSADYIIICLAIRNGN